MQTGPATHPDPGWGGGPTASRGVLRLGPKGGDEGKVTWVAVDSEPATAGMGRINAGLNDGDEVVLTGGGALSDGQAVRRFVGFVN